MKKIGLTTPMSFHDQNIICNLLQKINNRELSVQYTHFSFQSLKSLFFFIYYKSKKQKHLKCILIPVKCKLRSGFEVWGLSALIMLILLVLSFTRLFIVISVRLGLILALKVICGSFTLRKLFEFVSTHFWHNITLYFSLTNMFC